MESNVVRLQKATKLTRRLGFTEEASLVAEVSANAAREGLRLDDFVRKMVRLGLEDYERAGSLHELRAVALARKEQRAGVRPFPS